MINQIATVKTKTEPLPKLNRGLIQARHIQLHVKELAATGSLPSTVELWSPLNSGRYIVPVTRWIE